MYCNLIAEHASQSRYINIDSEKGALQTMQVRKHDMVWWISRFEAAWCAASYTGETGDSLPFTVVAMEIASISTEFL